MHAASVGEVQAARPLIQVLQKRIPNVSIVLTTMTMHGRRVAEQQLQGDVICLLAPLDVPWVVERGVKRIQPDMYICIETELWPLILSALSRQEVRVCMVNGRISERTYGSYLKMRKFIASVLRLFDRIAVISERDKEKYISLGAISSHVKVEGNVKYDMMLQVEREGVVGLYTELLNSVGEQVFIAGSTHTGEEELLLQLYEDLNREDNILFIVAPRHVERTEEIEKLLLSRRVGYQLWSKIKNGAERKELMVLIDTMGELAQLYSIADFVFCGGSLVKKGGHNMMEAAIWQKAVFTGPSIEDFRDGADLLQADGGGFIVENIDELGEKIRYFRAHPREYQRACSRAGEVALRQQGSSKRQVDYVLKNCD